MESAGLAAPFKETNNYGDRIGVPKFITDIVN
jgi:hypothetical protein